MFSSTDCLVGGELLISLIPWVVKVTAPGNLASPIVGAAARLHRHHARSQLRHKWQQLPASKLALHDCPAVPIYPVNLKQILRQVYSQCPNIHLRTLPRFLVVMLHSNSGPCRGRIEK